MGRQAGSNKDVRWRSSSRPSPRWLPREAPSSSAAAYGSRVEETLQEEKKKLDYSSERERECTFFLTWWKCNTGWTIFGIVIAEISNQRHLEGSVCCSESCSSQVMPQNNQSHDHKSRLVTSCDWTLCSGAPHTPSCVIKSLPTLKLSLVFP